MTTKSTAAPLLLGTAGPVTPAVRAEREAVLSMLRPVVDVIGLAVGNNVEIVLHDLTRPEHSVIKIVNGHVSGRTANDSILSGPAHDKAFIGLLNDLPADQEHAPHSLISDYRAFTHDGRALRSSTVIFRDSGEVAFASLCINADVSVVTEAHALLQSMLHQHPGPEPERDTVLGIDALIEDIIADAVHKSGKAVTVMDKDEKVRAVETMMQRGLFIVKGGVEQAAAALGVTRFTIYNYLDVLRERNVDTHLLPKAPSRNKSSGK